MHVSDILPAHGDILAQSRDQAAGSQDDHGLVIDDSALPQTSSTHHENHISPTKIDSSRQSTARNSRLVSRVDTAAHDEASSRSGSFILEKQLVLVPATPLPDKKYTRTLRNIRWTFCSVYRRLHFLVLAANIVAIIILAGLQKIPSITPQWAATAVSINLTLSVMMRQELVINALFWSCGRCPQWLPLRFRRLAAKIYHLGGIHSGAAVAATLWFLTVFTYSTVNAFRTGDLNRHKPSIIALMVFLDLLLVAIIVMALPGIRMRLHNQFELVHRFAGWTVLGLFWTLFALLTDAKVHNATHPIPASQAVAQNPIFWTLLVATISVALPWVWLRKVPVGAEPLSDHAVRLHFTYTNLGLCMAPRLSTSPLLEWHAFAGIPEEDGQGFSVLISKAGDWTSRIIKSPPTKMWVRGIPTMGVLHVAPVFKKSVLVATGSGIGPIMSLLHKRDVCCRILWSTPDPLTTYSKSIIDTVRRADPDAMIVNTTTAGRPDLSLVAYDLYLSSGAEAVFVISNPRVTRTVVYRLESRGVPTFAPIFDS
jgi:hypothetical protein